MNKLEKLRETIEDIKIDWDYEEVYNNLYNAIIDYENKTQNWYFEDYFNDIISYDIAEEYAKQQLEEGGLVRLYYFMGDANFNNDIFIINGYGNLENVDIDDLQLLKEQLLDEIDDRLKEDATDETDEEEEA